MDEYIITILSEKGSSSVKDIYEKVTEIYPGKSPSVILSRLMHLVESKYIELIYSENDEYIVEFKIRN